MEYFERNRDTVTSTGFAREIMAGAFIFCECFSIMAFCVFHGITFYASVAAQTTMLSSSGILCWSWMPWTTEVPTTCTCQIILEHRIDLVLVWVISTEQGAPLHIHGQLKFFFFPCTCMHTDMHLWAKSPHHIISLNSLILFFFSPSVYFCSIISWNTSGT